MGLKAAALDLLKPHISGDVLCLSYPDILLPFDIVQSLYPVTKKSPFGKWHDRKYDLPETTELLTLMGAQSVSYVDIVASRGQEKIVDLNAPAELGQFDLVIDPGTLEHCFNIGQGFVNAANAVKVGGHIFHANPASMMNHGFWGLNPTTYWDFYQHNGFDVLGIWIERDDELEPVHPIKRFQIPPECALYCLARREGPQKPGWPMQTKYKRNPLLI